MIDIISIMLQLLCSTTATLLVIAGSEKQLSRGQLRVVLAQIPHISRNVIKVLATCLGPLEILAGALYFAAPYIGTLLVSLFYLAFASVSFYFVQSGKKVKCNCFGGAFAADFTARKVVVNLLFGIAALMNFTLCTTSMHFCYSLLMAAMTILGFSVLKISKTSKQLIGDT